MEEQDRQGGELLRTPEARRNLGGQADERLNPVTFLPSASRVSFSQ